MAYEEKTFGDKPGLLKTERIDRISQRNIDSSKIRTNEEKIKALKKVQKLIQKFYRPIKIKERILS